ncbi:acid phosphatase [Vibrio alginolyticus]|uniref:acid phosphatase n=1 Tax=Vibrio alginolyticus TaxID=663 RepID=UPI001BD30CF0|nr:acid phosphatase [Vibrio alginolyticus]MBS9814430.1 acid phosphatase [Vibrio alginolyticus]MCR9535910.1 acid phosphatase [Vibrio alginolyticus]
MNKVSLLAASVAIALTGCGGSDGGSNSANDGVMITGFDGYFKHAVVFEDTNNNGQWDTQETFLGLTDEKGQLKLDAKPESTLALQTITPNGSKQKQLIALDAKEYAGKYTVDMDHPGQAMAHEIVFRAPTSSNVISPITDLVAIEMAKDPAISEEDAKAKVNQALGGSEEAPIDLYSDFVEGATKNAELHKTAQILTDSKAQNPTNYEKKATEFAQAANQEVERLVASGENINDPNLRPIITDATPDSDTLAPETAVNNKLTVNKIVEKAAKDKLEKLPKIVQGVDFDGLELDIEGLFADKDQNLVTTKLTHNFAGTGIEVVQTGNLIVLHPTAIVEKAGDFEIVLTAQDIDSSGKVLGTVSTVFQFEIESANLPPMVVETEQARLQSIVDGWYLQQGEVFEQTLDISGLFQDKDGQITDYSADYVDIEGLTVSEDGNAIITIKGTPTKAGEAGAVLAISATDGHTAVQIALSMPTVIEGVTPPPVVPTLGFTHEHFNGQEWKMGSFAQKDGEIGYAMLMQDSEGLLFCWGSNHDEMNQEYKANISDFLKDTWEHDAYAILADLDQQTGYTEYNNKDCNDVELKDGKLYNSYGDEYEMLYQHKTEHNGTQMIVKISDDELFWMDSSNTPFAESLSVAEHIKHGTLEHDLMVESNGTGDDTVLKYSSGAYEYDTDTYNYTSFMPTGFQTPGNWEIQNDEDRELLILEETGSESDYKTRHRYINRDFGDFYIGIRWSKEQNGHESAPEYGLYSNSKEAMTSIASSLPILEPGDDD